MTAATPNVSSTATQPSREVVFETRKLTRVYGRDTMPVTALGGVDLRLYAGEMAVLLGPSGSGKSTLLNIRAETRNVRTGRRNAAHAQVLEGLKDGERVILHPSDRIKDGTTIVERSELK